MSSSTCANDRIRTSLGLATDRFPRVDEKTLFQFYEYLSANLRFPFAAYYPERINLWEERAFLCVVLSLLDPEIHVGDEFDGLFCKIRKRGYELTLPLIELEIPQNSRNFQLIEDYWYVWNWR